MRLTLWVGACLLALGLTSLGRAQPASRPSSAPASAPSASIPTDEARELEEALAADAAVKRESAPAPTGGLTKVFQSLNPDISFIADVALAAFSTDQPLMVGGHDPTKSGFTLQQLELAVGGAVDPYFRFDGNLVFSQFGVEIEEVYATTLALPWNLQARAGQFLTRFGRINSTHLHAWAFVDQMLVIGKFFGGEGNRGLGAELSVLLPLPWYVELVGSMTDASGESTARSFLGSESEIDGPQDFQYTVAAKQFFPLGEDLSLMWGVSAALGPNPTGRGNRTDIYGTDLYLKYRPIRWATYFMLSLDAEWLLRRRQVPAALLQDHGLYAYVTCRFAKRWSAAARYEYVSGLDADPLDPDWTGLRQRAAANLTFFPTEFSRLRLQYQYDHPSWRSGYHGVMLAFEFAVGAHGAHKF